MNDVNKDLNGQTANYITQTVYWPHGAVRQMGYGNNVWHDLGTVSARLQPTGYWDTIGENPNAFLRLEYPNWMNGSGKNNGTLQSTQIFAGAPAPWQSLPNVTQNFGYDNLNRLTSASEGANWSQAYNYDQYGNMWMPTSTLGAPPLGPGAPTANVYTNNRNNNSTYDAAGNLTVFGSVSVAYDAENRQKTAGSNSYLYDGLGQRVGKTTSSGTTAYVYDAFGQLAAEYGSASSNLCTTCYLSYDHLGSTRMVTDQNANVVARHDYAPYGQEMTAGVGGRSSLYGASDNVRQKFTGYERDSETALDFAQARYMSSGLGRFTSPDPGSAGADFTNPQSWNGYAYVLGNPLNSTDPSGLCGGIIAGISSDPFQGGGKALLQKASQYGYDIAYPYAGDRKLGDFFKVFVQSFGAKIGATRTDASMIADVNAQTASTGGPSAFLAWSGGATSNQAAGVGANDTSVYQVMFSPGASDLPSGPTGLALSGSGFKDGLVNLTSGTTTGGTPGCGHDAACMWDNNINEINDLLESPKLGAVQSCPNPTVFLPGGVKIPLSWFFGRGWLDFSGYEGVFYPSFSTDSAEGGISVGAPVWVSIPGPQKPVYRPF